MGLVTMERSTYCPGHDTKVPWILIEIQVIVVMRREVSYLSYGRQVGRHRHPDLTDLSE